MRAFIAADGRTRAYVNLRCHSIARGLTGGVPGARAGDGGAREAAYDETLRPEEGTTHARRGREDQVVKEASRMPVRHRERHRTEHTGWLRAAVLGANDGILSTASLVLGVAAANGTPSKVLAPDAACLALGAWSWGGGAQL